MFLNRNNAGSILYQNGVSYYRNDDFVRTKNGKREIIGTIFFLCENQNTDNLLLEYDNIRLMQARSEYAPEQKKNVILVLSKAEIERQQSQLKGATK